VENLNATGADANPEALISTVAQPIFRERQILLFTPENYAQPQIVFVQGVDGNQADGDQLFRVRIESISSGDPGYNNLPGANTQSVQGVNTDNEAPSGGTQGIDILSEDGQPLGSLETNENGKGQILRCAAQPAFRRCDHQSANQ
jgi:stalled ribosome alternative rescue factor ArfA